MRRSLSIILAAALCAAVFAPAARGSRYPCLRSGVDRGVSLSLEAWQRVGMRTGRNMAQGIHGGTVLCCGRPLLPFRT